MPIAISTTHADGGEYAAAVREAGGTPHLLRFDVTSLDAQLDGMTGVLLSGGGDVHPREYGESAELADEIDEERDTFELALVRRARERGLPTLCICRGMQLANVAFGGTLIVDIGAAFDAGTAAQHRALRDGIAERGLVPEHVVTLREGSRLASLVPHRPFVTGSRHHQSIARIAADLEVVATTSDGVVEAVEARFPSPFWLGVQWHPESTVEFDQGASRAIFAAFTAAARQFDPAPVGLKRIQP